MHQNIVLQCEECDSIITDTKIVEKSDALAKKDSRRKQVTSEYQNCSQKFAKVVTMSPSLFVLAVIVGYLNNLLKY